MAYLKLKIVLFGIFILTQLYAEAVNAQKSIKNKEIVNLLEKELVPFPNQTEIAIASIHPDKSEFYGIIKKEDSLQLTANENSVFEIGSITKVFTSTLLSKLVSDGKVSLDDSVIDILPFTLDNPTDDQKSITLKMLANHTSGLPRIPQNMMSLIALDQSDPYRNYNSEKLYEYIKTDFKTQTVPGENNGYSNLGAGLLGHLLTIKTEKSYENLLQEYVFKPLSMNSSTTNLKKVPVQNLVSGLDPQGEETSHWNFDALAGAGAIKSNVVDLEKFVRKQMSNDPAYNLTQKETFVINEQVSMGLGWHIINKNDQTILFHNGGTGGYTSCLLINKKEQKAVIMLTNISAFHPKRQSIDSICFKILKLLNKDA